MDVAPAVVVVFFFFQAEDGIRDLTVTGVQTCALPISGVRSLVPRDFQRVPALLRGPVAVGHDGDTTGNLDDVANPGHGLGLRCVEAFHLAAEHRAARDDGDEQARPLHVDAELGAAVHLGRRSEEHTSELQSQSNLVCRLLLEKKKTTTSIVRSTDSSTKAET